MSDIRERLSDVIVEFRRDDVSTYGLTDAILERFDVVEKPVVTDEALGLMVVGSYQGPTYDIARCAKGPAERAGQRMRDRLEAAGLRIVKVEQP